MAVVGGPMLGQIEDGFNVLGDMTTSTTLNVSTHEKFSDAAMYVYHRASNDGCNDPEEDSNAKKPTVPAQIDPDIDLSGDGGTGEAGYPGLQGTFLGQEPPCIATDDATGADMEGKASRVQFVIDQTRGSPLQLDVGGSTWIEDNLKGARQKGLYEATAEECSQDIMGEAVDAGTAGLILGGGAGSAGGLLGGVAGGVIGGTVGFATGAGAEAIAGAKYVGVGSDYIIYFRGGAEDSRSNIWLGNADSSNFNDRIYCYALTDSLANMDLSWGDANLQRSPLDATFEDEFGSSGYVRLCPGDRGYIQMNKETPRNDGEAGEKWGSAYNFPFIQVTEKGECN